MKPTPVPSSRPAAARETSAAQPWTVRGDHAPVRSRPLMRRYEVTYLTPSAAIMDFTRIAPAMPAFENAFAAIARGTILMTETGPCAIEDLVPGDRVRTVDNGFQTLNWKGSMTLVPGAPGQSAEMGHLIRIAADSLGLGRPMPDLVLGPMARLFRAGAREMDETGASGAFVPVRQMIDGVNVIELTPMTPVKVYHLGFAGHERLTANGLEIESFHPGRSRDLGLSGELLQLYLSMFPHIRGFEDFGPMAHARLDNESASVAQIY